MYLQIPDTSVSLLHAGWLDGVLVSVFEVVQSAYSEIRIVVDVDGEVYPPADELSVSLIP